MQPIETFRTLLCDAKVSTQKDGAFIIFYHISFASEARVPTNLEKRQSFL